MEGIIMKTMRKVLSLVVAVAMVTMLMTNTVYATAKTKVKVNKKKVTLTITNSKKNPTTTLKVKGVSKKAAKKVKWTTSKKSVATVKKGKVTAKKAGKATITCKVNGKKVTCKVTVVDKRTPIDNNALNVTIAKKASDNKDLGPKFPRDISGEDPYGVNKITVTYNDKDVTNEAKYEIDEPQVAYVTEPGVIKATTRGVLFKLTVSYNGAKKTFRMGKTTVPYWYIECFCGTLFANDEKCGRQNSCGIGENSMCPYHKHSYENKCTNWWDVQYIRWIDIRIKG